MAQNLPISLDINAGLGSYLQAVNAAPMYSAEQEKALAIRFAEDQDLTAARELVLANLRHVVRIARGFMGYGLPLADLVQEGNIGLMKAVKRFDPHKDVRLVSFAVHWIKAEIYDYVLRNWRIVKVATTKAQRKLFFNLRKSRARLGWMRNDEVEALAEKLDVSGHTVSEMEARMSSTDISFDFRDQDDDQPMSAPAEYVADNRSNPEKLVIEGNSEALEKEKLSAALQSLDNRSREIISRRWLGEDRKATLHDLAAEFGVSAERIRQIEKRAMEKLKIVLVA